MGDLVYFKVKHIARYGCESQYDHIFDMNKPYLITDIHGTCVSIQDLTDKKFHFITEPILKFYTKEEYTFNIRQSKLERIL